MLKNIVGLLGDVRVHRFAAAFAAVAVLVVNGITANAVDFGLDEKTLATVVGVAGVVIAAAREIAYPVLLKPLFDLFGGNNSPN